MRKLLRKFIIWLIGFEPKEARIWLAKFEDENYIFQIRSEGPYDLPPRLLKQPKVEAREIQADDKPDECVIEIYRPILMDVETCFVIYSKQKPVRGGGE